MKYLQNLVSLKYWARKDKDRPKNAANIYKVIHETDKAIRVTPVAYSNLSYLPDSFWAPKSAVLELFDVTSDEYV